MRFAFHAPRRLPRAGSRHSRQACVGRRQGDVRHQLGERRPSMAASTRRWSTAPYAKYGLDAMAPSCPAARRPITALLLPSRQDRFLYGRQHAAGLLLRCERRFRPSSSPPCSRRIRRSSSPIPTWRSSRIEDPHHLRLQGRHRHLLSVAGGGLRLQREAGEALHLQRCAVPRRQEQRHAGAYITSEPLRRGEAGRLHAKLFLLADYGFDTYSTTIETRTELVTRRTWPWCSASSMPRYRLVQLPLWRQRQGQCADQTRQSGDDRRDDRLLHRQDEGVWHRRFRRDAQSRHRLHDRRPHQELLRQDGAGQGGKRRYRLGKASYTTKFVNKGVGKELRPK